MLMPSTSKVRKPVHHFATYTLNLPKQTVMNKKGKNIVPINPLRKSLRVQVLQELRTFQRDPFIKVPGPFLATL